MSSFCIAGETRTRFIVLQPFLMVTSVEEQELAVGKIRVLNALPQLCVVTFCPNNAAGFTLGRVSSIASF